MKGENEEAGNEVIRIRRKEPQIDQTAHAPIRIYTNPNTLLSLSLSKIAFCFVQSKSISICLSLHLKVYNKFNSQRNQSVASKLDASHGKYRG